MGPVKDKHQTPTPMEDLGRAIMFDIQNVTAILRFQTVKEILRSVIVAQLHYKAVIRI